MMVLALAIVADQGKLRHGSRRLPLKVAMKARLVGLPGREQLLWVR